MIGANNGAGVPDPSTASYEDQTVADRQAAAKAHQNNISLGLLAAGLSALAQRHRRLEGPGNIGNIIGQSGLVGLQAYGQAEDAEAKREAELQKQRELEAYRADEIATRRQAIQAQQHRTDVLGGIAQTNAQERVRRDQAFEGLTQQQRDIAAQQANTSAYRANLDAQRVAIDNARVGVEGARARAEIAPIGSDILSRYRGTEVERRVALPPPDVVAAMPRKDADALLKEVVTAYSKGDPNKKINFVPMGDGSIHKIVTDVTTGNSTDTIIGKAVPKGASSKDTLAAEVNKLNAAEGSPAATPVPTPTATPTATPHGVATPATILPPPGIPAGSIHGISKSRGPGWRLPDGTFVPDKAGG